MSGKYLKYKKILVTGASGSIGSALVGEILKYKPEKVMALDQDETGIFELMGEMDIEPMIANIRDEEAIESVFKEFKPDIVFHAAAYKHVPLMERFKDEAYKTNVLGTSNLVKYAQENDVERFIFISTDKAVNPVCWMGKTKRTAELIVANAGYTSVRFGNVLGSRGSVIPIWRKQIEKGEPITITDPLMERYFFSIAEACDLVLKAGELGKGGEIFVFDLGEPIKIVDLAEQVLRIYGKDVGFKIIGARPGEKIFEELLTGKEKKTKYDGLLVLRGEDV